MDIVLMLAALIFVLCLMVALAWGIQKLGLADGQNFLNIKRAQSLKVLEQLPIDPKRKLMIIQAGKTKYLIMTGAQNDLLIDKDIATPEAESVKSDHADA